MRALVSATDVVAVVAAHVDRVHDAAVRLGCTPDEAAEVVAAAADELVDDLAAAPETVGDLVGGLYARCRAAAARVRRGAGLAEEVDPTGDGLLGEDPAALAVTEALADLPERRRLAVLLVDSYAVTYAQAAVALGLDTAETARTVALGRAALVADVDHRVVPPLAGHDVAIGDLGQLSDGSAPAGGRFAGLRKHVSTCASCAETLGVQTRGRAMVAALPVLALDDDRRGELLARIGRRAAAALPSAELVAAELAGEIEPDPLVPRPVLVAALVAALVLGAGLGILLIDRGGNATVVAAPAATDSTQSSVAPTLAPATTPTSSASTGSSAPASTASASSTRPPTTSPTSRPPTTASTPTTATTTTTAPPTTAPPVGASIGISPASGPTGMAVTVSGSGFGAAALVTVTYERADGTAEFMSTTTTDANGAFTLTSSAADPGSAGSPPPAAHLFVATAHGHTANAPFDQTATG